MTVNLSTLAVVLGSLVILINLFGLARPTEFAEMARKFPRSIPAGYFFMILGTVWFIQNVRAESLADFEPMKPYLCALFLAVGVGSCIFVQDFLAVRGLAVVLLLLGKLMVDSERWVNTEWRLVMAVWAYVLVIIGIWLTVAPWRLRDLLHWATANEARVRVGSAVRLAFGLFILGLGFSVYKS